MHMVDLLVNPMQRLTKYSLLLKVIQAKTEDEDQLKALKKMVSSLWFYSSSMGDHCVSPMNPKTSQEKNFYKKTSVFNLDKRKKLSLKHTSKYL